MGGVLGLVVLMGVCTVAVAVSSNSQPSGPAARSSAAAAPAAPAVPTSKPSAAAPAARDGSCSPQPCANDNYGWIVAVSDVRYDVSSGNQFEKPEAGNVFVTVNVTFTNKLATEQHANPISFVLLDGAGIKHTVTFTDACPIWSPVNITSGATLGPKCLAFEATAGKPAGLVLVWTPQFAGGDYNIKLT